MGKYPYALQLYTVRDHLEKDVRETLAKVKQAGYDYVEVAGAHGLSYADFRGALDGAGLKAISVMSGFDEATGKVEGVIEAAHALDVQYAVIPFTDPKEMPDKAAWLRRAAELDAEGAALREAGIRLCYHNHAHEFGKFDGEYAFDIIFGAASAENLAAEIDTFWVEYAGLDPVELIGKYRGRCPLIHVKDMRGKNFAEVGRGRMDWGRILGAAEEAGAEWYIVEQDTCEGDSLESAAISAAYMGGL